MDPLMESNVYSLRGRVLIVGACLPAVWPESFGALAAEADQVYSLCLETTHVNMAVTKFTAVLGTGQVESLRFATVDRSPHCTQMHYIRHEIERVLPEHIPMESVVVTDAGVVPVTQEAVELSKSLARLSRGERSAP
ncbi:MAG: hypothetical protein IK095_09765 [Oscillospiraceae bacterium]|nr:hypothetical protein [Oscillospiraceae bacterium]